MSLRLWLPLTGNLENKGLCNTTVTNNGATVDNEGKIGKCYNFAKNAYLDIDKSIMTNMSSASVCFWVKINSWNTNWDTLFQAGSGATPWKAYVFGILRNQNNYLCFTISDGSSSSSESSYRTGNLEIGKWFHVACTYENNKCKTYLNGVLSNEYTATIIPNFASITSIKIGGLANAYKCDCLLNDFRIYDHALSPREIKEISKGLVLHYTLSQPGISNMTLNSNDLTLWSKESGMTCVWDDTQQMFKIDTTTRTSSRWGIYQDVTCEPNTTYTFSVDGKKVEKTMYLSVGSYASGSVTWPPNHQQFTNKRQRLSYTFTTGDNHTVIRIYLEVYPTAEGSNAAYYAFPKLEKSDHATPWMPNPADTLYSMMGLNNNIEYDVSGYGYNSIVNGSLSYNNNTPRYNMCALFDGSSNIKNTNFIFTSGVWSVSFWYYFNVLPTGYQCFFCLSKGNGADANKKIAACPNSSYIWFKLESASGSIHSIKKDEWVHIVMTSDGTTGKVYENGELKYSTSVGTIFTDCDDLVIGARANASDATSIAVPLSGNMSDFRIYATTLSADDVLELYHTPASITNSGVLMAQSELSEV